MPSGKKVCFGIKYGAFNYDLSVTMWPLWAFLFSSAQQVRPVNNKERTKLLLSYLLKFSSTNNMMTIKTMHQHGQILAMFNFYGGTGKGIYNWNYVKTPTVAKARRKYISVLTAVMRGDRICAISLPFSFFLWWAQQGTYYW